jgi:signal transduction histidine kinase
VHGSAAQAGDCAALTDIPLAKATLERRGPMVGAELPEAPAAEVVGVDGDLALPLLAPDGRTVGVALLDRPGRPVDPDDAGDRLLALAHMAGLAVDATGALEHTRIHLRSYQMLLDVATGMLGSLEAGEVLRRIASEICTFGECESSALLAWDQATMMVRGVAGDKLEGVDVHSIRLPVHRAPAVERAIFAGGFQRGEVETDPELCRELGWSSFIALPVRCVECVFGVIVLDEGASRLTEAQEETLSEFVRLAGIALQNAERHREARAPRAIAQASGVARDLHDGIAQVLAAIATYADAAMKGELPHAPVAERVAGLAKTGAHQLRNAIEALRFGKPALLGLGPALEELVADVAERTGLKIDLDVAPELWNERDAVADVLYRACREGITNTERHADAAECLVRVETFGDDIAVAVVEDNGAGPDDLGGPDQFGLTFLREAVEDLGGSVELRPNRPSGTVLVVTVPRRPPDGERSTQAEAEQKARRQAFSKLG